MLSRKHIEQGDVAVVVEDDDAVDEEVHAVVVDDDDAGVEEVVGVKIPICQPQALTEEYLHERYQLAKALLVPPNLQISHNHAAVLTQRTAALGPVLLPPLLGRYRRQHSPERRKSSTRCSVCCVAIDR